MLLTGAGRALLRRLAAVADDEDVRLLLVGEVAEQVGVVGLAHDVLEDEGPLPPRLLDLLQLRRLHALRKRLVLRCANSGKPSV